MNTGKSETFQHFQQWHRGDPKGLDALLERHLPWIEEKVRQRLGPLLRKKAETCDYIQDALVQFLQYGPRFTISSDEQLRALLLRIAENSMRGKYDWFTALRRDIARERPLPSDTVLSLDPPSGKAKTPSMSAERHEREAWVRLALELVDPEDREILVLREWENLSFAEIGERLGLSDDTAQKRHCRAVLRLSKEVDALRHRRTGFFLE